jgi:DNA sulfur modification protein DndD
VIIQKLTMNNFYRFYGTQEIVFSIDKNKNVTVIRGENGSGKTTILSAFYWALYGDVVPPLTEDNMLNYNKAAQMTDGEKTKVSVEVQFEDKGLVYRVERRQRFIKRNDSIHRLGETEHTVYYTNEIGNIKTLEFPDTFFQSIIPKRLRGFFFFDGERINRLAQIDGRDEIKEAILNILGLTNLENIDRHLNKIQEEYVREVRRYTKKIDEIEASETYTALNEEKEKYEEELERCKRKRELIKQNIDQINAFLQTHNSEIIKNLQREREQLEADVKRGKKQINDITKSLQNHISSEFKNYLANRIFKNTKELLEEKRKKGQLPSDIKEQFIEDLLEQKRCICGRSLLEGTPEYHIVSEMRKVAGRMELDDAYIRLTAYMKRCEENEGVFFQQLSKYIADRDEIENSNESKEKKIKEISKQIKASDEEKIRQQEELRIKFQHERDDIIKRISVLENKLEEIDKQLDKARKKINEAKFSNVQAERIQKYNKTVQQLGRLNSDIRQHFINSTRINLDAKIKEVFSKITRKEFRVPVLNENFELKIISSLKDTGEAEVLSTGEGQITSLAFIGSLVSYSREKAKSDLISDFAGGDFPIVMDSPFGNLDTIHTAHVAQGIGELASQVIVIVSDKQWSQEVEENISPRVGKMYIMLDGELDDDNRDEYTVIEEVRI